MECPQCKNPLTIENASVCEWCGNQLPIPDSSVILNFFKTKQFKWIGLILAGLILSGITLFFILSNESNLENLESTNKPEKIREIRKEEPSLKDSALDTNSLSLTPTAQPEEPDYINSTDVRIGDQIWKIYNLNVDRFRNGDIIKEAKSVEEWEIAGEKKEPAWCYYNNDPSIGVKFGKLYNYYAVEDSRGLGPIGWHVPRSFEIKTLKGFLGTNHRGAGKKMKSKSVWFGAGSGSNVSGFNGLPGGYRTDADWYTEHGSSGREGEFRRIGEGGFWWVVPDEGFYKCEWFKLDEFDDASGALGITRSIGSSIRLVKD